jgi:hypothetical protein
MPARAVKERLAQDVALWQADGEISAETATVLRRRYDVPGFGWGALFRYLGISGGIFTLFGILGLVGAMAESVALGVVLLGGLAAAFLFAGVKMARDPLSRAPHAAKMVLTLGMMLATGASALLASTVHAGDAAAIVIVGLLTLPLTFGLAYRYSITFLLVLGLIGFFHWVGSWTSMLGRSTYAVDVQDPQAMTMAALLALAIGVVHERQPVSRWPRFHHAYEALGLTYLNLCLLILSIEWNHNALVWSIVFTLAALAQIVAGARLGNGLLTGFGVTAFAVDLFTRFYESFWNALDKGVFFLLVGLVLFLFGAGLEWLMRRARPAPPGVAAESTSKS